MPNLFNAIRSLRRNLAISNRRQPKKKRQLKRHMRRRWANLKNDMRSLNKNRRSLKTKMPTSRRFMRQIQMYSWRITRILKRLGFTPTKPTLSGDTSVVVAFRKALRRKCANVSTVGNATDVRIILKTQPTRVRHFPRQPRATGDSLDELRISNEQL